MEPAVIAALASIAAALIALIGAIFNRRKTEEAAEQARLANVQVSERLKRIDEFQQTNLAQFKSELDRITFVVNANYSIRVEVLTEAYSKLAEIKILMESFVVPLFPHSTTGNPKTIRDAADKFEELYKFCSMKAVFFASNSQFMNALGQLMGHINHMLNNARSGNSSSWAQQANVVISGVSPVLSQIRDEVRQELKFDLQPSVRGDLRE
jgi:hypothetical protein